MVTTHRTSIVKALRNHSYIQALAGKLFNACSPSLQLSSRKDAKSTLLFTSCKAGITQCSLFYFLPTLLLIPCFLLIPRNSPPYSKDNTQTIDLLIWPIFERKTLKTAGWRSNVNVSVSCLCRVDFYLHLMYNTMLLIQHCEMKIMCSQRRQSTRGEGEIINNVYVVEKCVSSVSIMAV